MRYEQLINELHIINMGDEDDHEYDGKNVLFNTIDGNVFIFTYNNTGDLVDRLVELYDMGESDADDAIYGNHPKFITANIVDGLLNINASEEDSPNSVLNKQVAKIVKQLDLDGITYENQMFGDDGEETDIEQTYSRDEVLNATVKTTKFYHGTSSKFLKEIMSKGLMGTDVTNYFKIEHENKVFVTTKLSKAAYHAINACQQHGGVPVILLIKLSDPNKLVLDYDVALIHYGIDHPLVQKLGYDAIFHDSGAMYANKMDDSDIEEWKKLADKSSINTKSGIFGYQGRIPASDIKGFYIDEQSYAMMSEFGYGTDELGKSYPAMVKDSLDDVYKSYSDFISDVNVIIEEYNEELEDDD